MAAQAQRPQQEEVVTEEESFGPIPVGKLEVIPPGSPMAPASCIFPPAFAFIKQIHTKHFCLILLFSSHLYVISMTRPVTECMKKMMQPGYVTLGN